MEQYVLVLLVTMFDHAEVMQTGVESMETLALQVVKQCQYDSRFSMNGIQITNTDFLT